MVGECVKDVRAARLVYGDSSLYWWNSREESSGIYRQPLLATSRPSLYASIAIESPSRYRAGPLPQGRGYDEFEFFVGGPLAFSERGLVAAVNQTRARRPRMVCGSCVTEDKQLSGGRLVWLPPWSEKPVVLAQETSVAALVADNARVYWMDDVRGGLYSVEYPKEP